MVQMTQEQDWQNWLGQELIVLGNFIEWTLDALEKTNVKINTSRYYGVTLLAQSIECAQAIHLCIRKGLAGVAFSLARVQYEGALRGHIIIHEIDLDELNDFLDRTQRWKQHKQSQQPPPQIEVDKTHWKCGGAKTKIAWRPLQYEVAKLLVESIENLGLLHDLTHSGITHALQRFDEDGDIKSSYSDKNQTLLLCFTQKILTFVLMTYPGVQQKYNRELEQCASGNLERWSILEPHIRITAG